MFTTRQRYGAREWKSEQEKMGWKTDKKSIYQQRRQREVKQSDKYRNESLNK